MLSSAGGCACFLCFWRCCMGLGGWGGAADGGNQPPTLPPPSAAIWTGSTPTPISVLQLLHHLLAAASGPSCRLGGPKTHSDGHGGSRHVLTCILPNLVAPCAHPPMLGLWGGGCHTAASAPARPCLRVLWVRCRGGRAQRGSFVLGDEGGGGGQEGGSCQLMELALCWGRAGTRLLTACPMRPRGRRGHPTASCTASV